VATEVERLEAELALAKKVEELIAAKEGGDLETIKALKVEVAEMRAEARKDRVAGAVGVMNEGDAAVVPETIAGATADVKAPGGVE